MIQTFIVILAIALQIFVMLSLFGIGILTEKASYRDEIVSQEKDNATIGWAIIFSSILQMIVFVLLLLV